MRLCVDCKYHLDCDGKHKCTAILDLVTGEQQDIECLEARQSSWLCGIEGKLFKESDAKRESRAGGKPVKDG